MAPVLRRICDWRIVSGDQARVRYLGRVRSAVCALAGHAADRDCDSIVRRYPPPGTVSANSGWLERHRFEVIKFRTMPENAEDAGAVWADYKDKRATRLGRILRSTRIDELPQLFNVLRGEMSMVGPRPERPVFVEQLDTHLPYYSQRHRIKPGITGWAQLCYPYGASVEDAKEKLQYDLYYVKNHSILLDMIILLKTVEVVLVGEGAR